MAANYFEAEFERLRQRSTELMSEHYNLENWDLQEWMVRDPALILAKRDIFQTELNRRLGPIFEEVPRPIADAAQLDRVRDAVLHEHELLLQLAREFDDVAQEMGPKVRNFIRPEVTIWKRHLVLACNRWAIFSEISTGQPRKSASFVPLFGLFLARANRPSTSGGNYQPRRLLGHEDRTSKFLRTHGSVCGRVYKSESSASASFCVCGALFEWKFRCRRKWTSKRGWNSPRSGIPWQLNAQNQPQAELLVHVVSHWNFFNLWHNRKISPGFLKVL